MNATPILDYLARRCDPVDGVVLTRAEALELRALVEELLEAHDAA